MRKCRELISHSLSISSFSHHFLFIFSFSLHYLAARLPGCHNLCNPARWSKWLFDLTLTGQASSWNLSRTFIWTPCVAFAVKQTPHLIPDIFQHFVPLCVKGGKAEGGVPAVFFEPSWQVHPARLCDIQVVDKYLQGAPTCTPCRGTTGPWRSDTSRTSLIMGCQANQQTRQTPCAVKWLVPK